MQIVISLVFAPLDDVSLHFKRLPDHQSVTSDMQTGCAHGEQHLGT